MPSPNDRTNRRHSFSGFLLQAGRVELTVLDRHFVIMVPFGRVLLLRGAGIENGRAVVEINEKVGKDHNVAR